MVTDHELTRNMSQSTVIIDIHCHAAGIGAEGSGCFVSAAMRKNWRYKYMPIVNTGVTSPWFHAYRLLPRSLGRALREQNPWDRDVALKRALGMPDEILTNAVRLLNMPAS